jgi:hypothetical protein
MHKWCAKLMRVLIAACVRMERGVRNKPRERNSIAMGGGGSWVNMTVVWLPGSNPLVLDYVRVWVCFTPCMHKWCAKPLRVLIAACCRLEMGVSNK